jgi:hypothetical protein
MLTSHNVLKVILSHCMPSWRILDPVVSATPRPLYPKVKDLVRVVEEASTTRMLWDEYSYHIAMTLHKMCSNTIKYIQNATICVIVNTSTKLIEIQVNFKKHHCLWTPQQRFTSENTHHAAIQFYVTTVSQVSISTFLSEYMCTLWYDLRYSLC